MLDNAVQGTKEQKNKMVGLIDFQSSLTLLSAFDLDPFTVYNTHNYIVYVYINYWSKRYGIR